MQRVYKVGKDKETGYWYGLPKMCLTKSLIGGETVLITRGEPGYAILNDEAKKTTNEMLDVDSIQEYAMVKGSMHGFNTALACPGIYGIDSKGEIRVFREKVELAVKIMEQN